MMVPGAGESELLPGIEEDPVVDAERVIDDKHEVMEVRSSSTKVTDTIVDDNMEFVYGMGHTTPGSPGDFNGGAQVTTLIDPRNEVARNNNALVYQALVGSPDSVMPRGDAITSRARPHVAGDHYGQALFPLDRMVRVRAGRRVTLLLKREQSRLTFALRPDLGVAVPRAPWLEEWGGGSSVENPHVQRVKYCELLVKEFVQKCRGDRYPTIERDMRMLVAHCGSLFLDTMALQEIFHALAVTEHVHKVARFSGAAVLEAIIGNTD